MQNDVLDTIFKSCDTCGGMLQYICLYTHHCERIKEPLMRKNRTFTAASHTHTYPRVQYACTISRVYRNLIFQS